MLCISRHLNLPINHEALGIGSTLEISAKAVHSKIHPAVLQPQIKRAPLTAEEDAKVLEMRENGSSWKEIQTVATIWLELTTSIFAVQVA